MEEIFVKEEANFCYESAADLDSIINSNEEIDVKEEEIEDIIVKEEPTFCPESPADLSDTEDPPDKMAQHIIPFALKLGRAPGKSESPMELKRVSTRVRIIELYLAEKSSREISEEVGVSRPTVNLWIRRHRQSGDLTSLARSGRPKTTTAQQDEDILAYSRQHPNMSATVIREKLRLPIHVRSVRSRLHTAGRRLQQPVTDDQLTAQNIADRFQFAHQFSDCDAEFWRSVIFADEKVFVSSEDGPLQCWPMDSTRLVQDDLPHEQRSGRISQAYFGWMCAYGVGELVRIDECLTGMEYMELLEEVLLPSVRAWALPEPHVITLAHDDSPLHTSAAVRQFLRAHPEIEPLLWPSGSADINVIENLWDEMVKEWGSRKVRTVEALHLHTMEVWESFRRSPQLCERLIASLPRRFADVIAAEGKYSKY